MPTLSAFGVTWPTASDDFVFSSLASALLSAAVGAVVVAQPGEARLVRICAAAAAFAGVLFSLLLALVSALGAPVRKARRRWAVPWIYVAKILAVRPLAVGFELALVARDGDLSSAVGVALLALTVIDALVYLRTLFRVLLARMVALSAATGHSKRLFAVWQRRILRAIMHAFCLDKQTSNAVHTYERVARLVTDFAVGVDLTDTDALVGLLLVRRHQKQDRRERDMSDVPLSRVPNVQPREAVRSDARGELDLDEQLALADTYAPFVLAVYGWPMHVFLRPCTGPARLCCCAASPLSWPLRGALAGDNCLGCNRRSLALDLPRSARLLHASYMNGLLDVPYVVAEASATTVVICIRGTLSLQDVLRDIDFGVETVRDFDVGPAYGGAITFGAHRGFLQAARKIRNDLNVLGLLNGYQQLVVTGHSLGAGVAAVLTLLLLRQRPEARCLAYSPPAATFTHDALAISRRCTTSFVYGNDMIGRASIHSVERLRDDIVRMLARCRRPKWTVWLRLVTLRLLRGGDGLTDELDEDGRRFVDANCKPPSKEPPTYLPGVVVHLQREGTTDGAWTARPRRKHRAVHAIVTDARDDAYTHLLVAPSMLVDHLPFKLAAAIKRARASRRRG